MAYPRYDCKFSDKPGYRAEPADLRSDFCVTVTEFITFLQLSKTRLKNEMSKNAFEVLKLFIRNWQVQCEKLDRKWKFAVNKKPKYDKRPVTNYIRLSKHDIDKFTKIFQTATDAVFEKEWVRILDLIIEFLAHIYDADEIYYFRKSWNEYQQIIFDLWAFALQNPAAGPTRQPTGAYGSDTLGRQETGATTSEIDAIFKHGTVSPKGYDNPQADTHAKDDMLDSTRSEPHALNDNWMSTGSVPSKRQGFERTFDKKSSPREESTVPKHGRIRSAPSSSRHGLDARNPINPANTKERSPSLTRYDNVKSGEESYHICESKDIQSLHAEIEKLKAEVENDKSKYRSKYNEMKILAKNYQEENANLIDQSKLTAAKIQRLQNNVQLLQNEKQQLQCTLQRQNEELKTLKANDQQLQKSMDHIAQLEKQNRIADQEKAALLDQLSAAMNRQMSRDETDLENINVKNRPMKILQEFELFCSQEWLEAKGDLDESAERMNPRAPLSEGDRCTLLCMVLTESFKAAEDMYMLQKRRLAQMIGQYADKPYSVHEKHMQPTPSDSLGSLDKDFEVCLAKMLKHNSDKADFQKPARAILEAVFTKQIQRNRVGHDVLSSRHIDQYACAALSISWRMVIQQPPMAFDSASLLGQFGPISDQVADPHFGSADPRKTNAYVQYYVYPAILHGGSQMKKARVFLAEEVKTPKVREFPVHRTAYFPPQSSSFA